MISKTEKKDANRYLFWAFLFLLLIFSYFILRDYLVSLISAFIFAYLARPIHTRIERKTGKSLGALLSIFLVLAAIIIPFSFVLNAFIGEAAGYFTGGNFSSLVDNLRNYSLIEKLIQNENASEKIGSAIGKIFASFFLSLPKFVVSILISLFAVYYLLIDWDRIAGYLKRSIPLKDKDEIVREISEITNIMIYGTLFVGLIEFAVAGLGFYFLGIKFYLLLAGLIFLFAFIPGLGPMIVWIPLMIYYFIKADYLTAIGILIIGLILSIGLDIVFKTRLIGKKSKMNALIVLLGILGGVPVFGFFGFVIGPLILAYAVKILGEVFEG